MARVFVALSASPALAHEVSGWAKLHAGLPIRWISAKDLHVTVVPPWETECADSVCEALRTVAGTIGPLPLLFTRVRFGPSLSEPRLIWAEGEAPDQLFELKHSVERALAKTPGTGTFRLHLTMARFHPEQFARFPQKKLNDPVQWEESVESYVLMESHRNPDGAQYEVLEQFRL